MKISEVMTPNVELASPTDTVQQAAKLMARIDAGVLPVGENDRLVGMITDRDIAIRAVGEGRGPDTQVSEIMSREVKYCFDDDDIEEVAMKMSDAQVRRFPVISRDDKKLIGIVSLGDLSRSEQADAASVALGGVTDPGGKHDQSTESH